MAIAAGNRVYAKDLAMETRSNEDTTSRTTSSTSFTPTLSPANICGIDFVAPPSGKVMLFYRCHVSSNNASYFAVATPAVRTGSTVGSGSSAYGAGFAPAIIAYAGGNAQAGSSQLVSGLTPGDIYNCYFEHQVENAAAIGSFRFRAMFVVPQLA